MKTLLLVITITILLFAGLLFSYDIEFDGVAGNMPEANMETEPLFFKGEEFTFDVYCKGIKLGESVLTFHGEKEISGKSLYHISFLTKAPFFEDYEDIYAEKETLLPVKVSRTIKRFGSFATKIEENYDQKNFKVDIVKKGQFSSEKLTIQKEAPIYNALLLPYLYRLKPDVKEGEGMQVTLPMAEFYVRLDGKEEVETPMGTYNAYIFSSEPSKFTFWLSADDEKIPIKIESHTALDYSLLIRSKKKE